MVKGLWRTGSGPFVRGSLERLRASVDPAVVKDVRWSSSAGALVTSGSEASWTLPEADSAELVLTALTTDGRSVVTTFSFALVAPSHAPGHPLSVSDALLATPMPVLDGGVPEVSGGACTLEYDASANIHLAFTTETHASLYYGKWNGSTWTLEVVDTLGFNTGGRILPSVLRMVVDSAGTPHILYVRDLLLFYATKSGGNWVRERVDTAALPLADSTVYAPSLGVNAQNRPLVAYVSYSTSSYRQITLATRPAPGTWSVTIPAIPTVTPTSSTYPRGDILFDAFGNAFMPAMMNIGSGTNPYLLSFGTTGVNEARLISGGSSWDTWASGSWAGPPRAVFRTSAGLYDVTFGSPLSATTLAFSATEQTGAGVGDIAWNGRPVVLHHHNGGSMELVTPSSTGPSFWTWTQLGNSSGVSGAVAVHPTTGVPSICYQYGGHIMFQ